MEALRLFQHTKDTSNNIEIIIRVAFRDNYSISRQVNLVEIIIGVAFRDSYSSSIWLKRVEIIIGVAFLDNYSSIENIFELIPTQRINKYLGKSVQTITASSKNHRDYQSMQYKSFQTILGLKFSRIFLLDYYGSPQFPVLPCLLP